VQCIAHGWWRPALPGVLTLPEHFRKGGYLAVGGGKVFHHTLGNNPPGLWDHYQPQVQDAPWHFEFPLPGQQRRKPGVHWPEGFPLNGIEAVRLGRKPPRFFPEFDWGPLDRSDLSMGDGQMVRWAVEFLGRKQEKPFFLAAGIYRPHLPWYAPRKYFELYPLEGIELPRLKPDDLDDVPPAGRRMVSRRADFELILREGKYREAVQAYLASISFADALVGRLLDALDASPYARNTLIVLWSDHGWHLGEKSHWHKMTLWERATRVPFIVSGPGVARGKECRRPVGLIDIYPTLVDLCSLPERADLDGISLVSLLKDPGGARDRPALTTYLRGNHAVRDGRWRYIRYANGDEELYDHEGDPREWTNLASHPEWEHIKRRLARWLPRMDAPDVPLKKDYVFDLGTYTWRKVTSGQKNAKP